MKIFIKLFLIFTLFSFHCLSQLTFQKSYTFSGGAAGTSGVITDDGGYCIAGYALGAGNTDFYLIKTDSVGVFQWAKTYGNAVDDIAYSLSKTFDGGYIIGGVTFTSIGNRDFLLVKVDSSGDIEWSKKYDNGALDDFMPAAIQTADSGFAMIGLTHYNTSWQVADMYVIKTDINGNLMWNKAYHINNCNNNCHEMGISIQQTTDGGYILLGKNQATGGGNKIWLVKTNSSGDKIWDRTYGYGYGNSVKQTSDRGYIITGYELGYADVILIKTDSLGSVEWENLYKRYPTSDIGNSVQQTSDGGFIVTGHTGNLGSFDVFILKTDSVGNTLWKKFYGGTADDAAYSIMQTNDGGYAVFGLTDNFPQGNRSVYLIKTDSIGNSGCNEKNIVFSDSTFSVMDSTPTSVTSIIPVVTTPSLLTDSGGVTTLLCFSVGQHEISNEQNIKSIFPNPTSGKITITFSDFVKNGLIKIYNVLGEIVLEDILFATTKKEINLKGNLSGIYFVMLFDGEKYYCKKLIIEQN